MSLLAREKTWSRLGQCTADLLGVNLGIGVILGFELAEIDTIGKGLVKFD